MGRSDLDSDQLRLAGSVGLVVLGRCSTSEAAEWFGVDEAKIARHVPVPRSDPVELSVAVAAFNEAASLPALWARLEPVLEGFGHTEVVLVDDGSRDETWNVITALAAADSRVRGVRLSRNFGQQAALTIALEEARGRAVVCVDADLQDPPELIPKMVERWRAGADVVYGVRRRRQATVAKRVAYRLFYRVYRRLSDVSVPLDSGDFALLDRRVVDALVALPERTRFLRGLRSWVGFTQEPLEYDRPERAAGQAQYTVRKLVKLALDGLVSLSSVPLRFASILGVLVALAGSAYIGVAVLAKLLSDDVPKGWTSTIALVLLLGGAQLAVVGVLGEYVARVYDETKRRPHALVRDRTGGFGGR